MSSYLSRSYLFVPANRIDRVSKALAAGPHEVIVDLEDAVPPADKASARSAVATSLTDANQVLIRINGPESEWFDEDLKLCADAKVKGVVIPKTEHVDHLHLAAQKLGAGALILPLIETAKGYANLESLCSAPQVQRLVFGSIDFQVDLGITGECEELLYFRSGLVLASTLAGIQAPVDGVTVDLSDIECIRQDTIRAKRLGFGGKLCIHPKQVTHVNDCFRPSETDVAWAQRVMDAAAATNGGAVAVDGKMVDRPVMLKAEEILHEAKR